MLALVVGAGVAGATPTTPGMQLYQAGERAFRRQHWEEARRSFAAAYELDRKPELLYDVALATWRLAREDETLASLQAARAAYQRYLDEATAGRRRKAAQEALAQIEAQLPQPQPQAPVVADEDEDPARPLDPYAGVHKLPPIPKPVIVGAPATPTPTQRPANLNLPKGMVAVEGAPARSPEELHKSTPVQSKPETPKPETPQPPAPAKPAQTTQRPKGVVEIGRDPEVPPRGPRELHAPPAIVATRAKPKEHAPRAWVTPVVIVGVLCAAGLAIGLGVGLSEHSSSSSSLGSIVY
jgi:hypothetical protein